MLEYEGETFTEAGTYTINLMTQASGCDSLIHLTLDFLTSTRNIDVSTIMATVFPNPTSTNRSQLRLQALEKERVHLRLLDYTGQQYWEQTTTIPAGSSSLPINLPETSGVYWLQLLTADGEGQYFKVIKI